MFPLCLEALEARNLLSTAQQPAILLLDPSGSGSLAVSDHGSIQGVGTAVVDSKSSSAVDVEDHGSLSAGELDIVGSPGQNVAGDGQIVGPIYTGITPQKDPLASLRAPKPPSTVFKASEYSGRMYPGLYENGIDISGHASVTMQPGVYYVEGSFTVSGFAQVRGTGVTIYISPNHRTKTDDALEVFQHAVATLSPPTSGGYKGITLFESRSSNYEIEVSDHGTLNLIGTVYAAGGQLFVQGNGVFKGGSDAHHLFGSQFIGYDMQVQDHGKILLNATDYNALSLTAALSPAPVTLPGGTLVTNTADCTIVGKTVPLATVALQIGAGSSFANGTTTADASGNYSLPVSLTEGANTLQVRVTSNGRRMTQTIRVTLDTTPPAISVSSPAPGLVTDRNITISGQVTDSGSGVASLQVALDGGGFTPVTLGSGGSFTLTTTLPLDGTADGSHTEQFKATDNAGNVSFFNFTFTLDTVAPTITVTSPANGLITNQNVTITGEVTDKTSGVASLEAALDNGTFAPVSFGSNGSFSLVTTLALDGAADGPHTEHLKAADNAGNVSTVDVTFTLDTVAPTITVTSPTPGVVTNQNVTIAGQVTDALSGVASLQAALDNGSFSAVTLGSGGSFSFVTTLPLDGTADGSHTGHLKATDNASNVSTFDVTFTLDTVAPTISVTSPAQGVVTNQNVTVAGQVTDAVSGVASLQAALDNGSFSAVTLGSGGSFSFVTTLPLDGTADGSHTEHLKATDNAGNVSTFAVSFTLDTVAPIITVTSPAQGVVTNQNVTIAGQVTDTLSGVASLQAALDNGSFGAVTLGSGGSFSFVTTLPLDGTADGSHAEHLKATDNAGNISTFDVTFTLQTTSLAVDFGLDPAFDTPPVGDGHTQFAVVTLTGTTEPDITVVLEQTGASTTSDSTGAFSFSGVALALGANTFTVQATDQAGNTSTVQHTITRDSAFDVTLVEGTQLLTTFDQAITVPSAPSVLQFTFGDLNFDTSSSFIKDAFEASLTDVNGNSLVLPIAGSRDAFLNITANQAPVLGPNVQVAGSTVDVDLSHIPAGTQAQLEVRLVNNDSNPDTDTNTTVGIDKAQVIAQAMNTPAAVTPAAAVAAATSSIDFSALTDVSTSMTATYGQTSFIQQSGVLYAGLTIQNTGTFPVDAPLVAVVAHLSDPSIHVRGSDGVTPDGLPYFDLSGLIGGSTLAAGQATATRTLSFSDPGHIQFTYDLEILGQLNRPPAFTSEPNTEAIPGLPYVYQAMASDPDNDPLTFSLLIDPAGMTVDAVSGKVTWSPELGDLGNETVLLQVDDGHGGTAQQQYTVSVIAAPPNGPPLFTSTPVVVGNVNTPYTYQATAADPDGDPLTYYLGASATPVAVTNPSFETPVLGAGQFATGNFPGWTVTGTAGPYHPTAAQFPGGVPDGQNIAFDNGGTIAQVLSAPLTAATHYVLQVDVGESLDVGLAPFSVELWAGGLLASASTPLPADGAFTTVTVTYDALDGSPFLGQLLEIRLISAGAQVSFDNVRLTATPAVEVGAALPLPGMAIDSATGLVTWTPTVGQLGPQSVSVRAEDGRGGIAVQTFTVNVLQESDNEAPVIVSQPITALETPLPAPNRPLHTLDFEGIPAAPSFIEGSTIPANDTLSDRFLTTDGVTFRSGSGVPYIAVVDLGFGHATSGTNGIGAMQSSTILDYATPIIAEFFLPNDPTTPAATDFVSIRADNIGDGRTIFLDGYDANGVLLATTSAVDVGGETLTLATPGIHSIRTRGDDGTQAFDDLTFAEVYAAPAYRYDVHAIDPDHDAIAYSLTSAPPGMVIDATTGLITWFPPAVAGSYPVTVRADDGRGAFDTQSFNVVVAQAGAGEIDGTVFDDLNGNGSQDPMEPGLAGRVIYLDQNHNGIHDSDETSVTTDANGNYSFINLPPGVYTVAMEGQPGSSQTLPSDDAYSVTVPLGETVSGVDFGAAPISSGARPPTITSTAPTVAAVGQLYRYDVSVHNPDGVALQFDFALQPDGMTVDPSTGVIDWTPTASQVGSQDAIVRVQDARGDVVLQAFQVNVSLETAPLITSTPPNPATTLLPYRYQVEAQDAENDPLTYGLLDGPVGMTIDSSTGVISWVGAPIGPGLPARYPVSVQVSDGRGGQDTQSFTLLVVADTGDQAPVISSPPATSVALGHNYLYPVLATDPDGDPLAYDLPAAPTGMTIDASGLIQWTPSAAQFGPNGVTVRVQDGRGGTATQAFTIDVTAQPSNRPPSITSTPSLAATVGRGYDYDATGADPDGSPLVWDLEVAPFGMSVNPRLGTIRWTPTADQLGSQEVVIRLTNGEGLSATQTFAVQVRAIDVPPLITSTPPTQAAAGQTYTYAVDAADVAGDPLTYRLTAFATGTTIDAATGLIQWTPTADQVGLHFVAVAVDDGQGGTATQAWTVIVSAQPPEQPPTITSTPDFDATVETTYTYQVSATNPENVTLQYSLPLARAGMTIDPASGLVQWTPTTGQLGTAEVAVAVADGLGGAAVQDFTINVQATNDPPVIKSSPITTATAGAPYEYDVTAVDPDGDALTYTLVTAPTGMTIDSLGRITWSPQVADIGNQPVDVSVSDGRGGTVSQSFTITAATDTQAPQVILTLSANPVDLGTSDMAVVTATDNVGVTSMTLTLNGAPIPLDTQGRATLPDDTAGTFTVVASASDAAGNVGTDSQTLQVINPQVTNAPVVAITTPADGDTVTAPTQVIGTVQDPNLVSYTLSVAPIGSNNFTTFFTGTSQVTNDVLGTLDPTMLQNDSYDLRLTATNTGGLSSTADVTVNVADNLKLGNFTLSFTDLTVPVSGIPITVTRTYDTLNANQSEDFGYGWRLEYRAVDLQTSVAKTGEEADGFFNPLNIKSKVYVTLPGGQREGFTFQPQLQSGLSGGFLGMFQPNFVPDAGVTDSLTVAPANLRLDDTGNAYDFETGLPYNPADPNFGGSYLLTTNGGITYSIDGVTGQLTKVSDSNNDTLIFSAAGIVSSSGASITFERDAQGRISAIIDPMGQKLLYQYDANGNLVAVTDRSDNTTQFVYLSTPAHYLNQVIDPLGRTGTRTDYDAQGRLSQLIDAAGNPVQLTYDPTDSLESATDQLGNTTTYVYDDRGNIVKEIDPLGAVTLRTYDANNNMLTQTDPLGRTTTYTYDGQGDLLTETDPLGNTTINTYQAFTFGTTALAASRGQAAAPFTRPVSSTDPLGDTTHASYDFFGNVASQTDALGNTTTMSNNAAGDPAVITDPLGNVTTNQYDGNGNRTLLVDADGHVTNLTYDANGNPLSQTQADGSGWNLSYNANNMPTSLGLIGLPNTVQYDAANEISQVTEPNGETAAVSYDALGDISQVALPDGTILQSNTYDAVGNLIATKDSFGNVTQYAYDADKRLIQTTYPDGSTEKRTYDLAGELVAVTDALGNTTRYVYDADGRQIQTIDALGGVASTQYDAAGRKVATTDPLGQTTRYQYDANGRQIATIAPDGSIARSVYDADGRLVQTIDAAGNVTAYGYDPAGNLVSVTDAFGNVTTYQYGDQNQKVATTDANGNVTRYSYDAQGHLVQTTLPDGETSSSTYDSSGNLASTTNGNGQTIQYGYDLRGQQTSLTLPDGSQETYTYTSDGLLSSVTDASGTTTYDYDPLTRFLVRVTEPDGRYIRYAYDANGNRTLMADSMGAGQPEDATQYAYDALGRLVQVTDPQGGVTTYTYDADGNLTTTTLPNGVTETDTYDAQNRLVAIVDKNAAGATISSFTYTLDANGNRTREDEVDGSYVLYTYDALNRVTSEEHFSSGGILTAAETYTYDALGNVTARSGTLLGDAAFTYNGDNQLVIGAGSTYAYDGAGNLVSVTDSTGNVTRYNYDAQGRLASEQAPDGTITTYTYDYQGVRQSQQGPNGLVKYLVDEANGPGSAQVVLESDSTGATLRSYVSGVGLISLTEGGNVRYYLTDALGSTRSLTDPTGAVTDSYSYSAYGALLAHTGSSDNRFLFAGQDQDASSGLVYLRARYYDPNTGRFLSPDSATGNDQLPLSLNKYLYCLANPVLGTDPSGHDDIIEVEESQIIAEQEDAAESSLSVKEYVDDWFKTLQTIGAVYTMITAVRGIVDPGLVGGFFGGLVLNKIPIGVVGGLGRIAIGIVAEFYLFRMGLKMAGENIIYIPSEPEEAGVSANAPAWTSAAVAKDIIWYKPQNFFGGPIGMPTFPPPDFPVSNCQIGVLIHEFAHLTSERIDDQEWPLGDGTSEKAYDEKSLLLLPWKALFNADNYRIAVQAVVAGLSAEEV
jgi:RHS repeat-associated protein